MGVRVLRNADGDMAALYCSTTGVAFGPVFHRGPDGEAPDDLANEFLEWHWQAFANDYPDPRMLTQAQLAGRVDLWQRQRKAKAEALGGYDHVADGWSDHDGLTGTQRMSLGEGWPR